MSRIKNELLKYIGKLSLGHGSRQPLKCNFPGCSLDLNKNEWTRSHYRTLVSREVEAAEYIKNEFKHKTVREDSYMKTFFSTETVEKLKHNKCYYCKKHAPKKYISIWGNLAIGNLGGLVGDNFSVCQNKLIRISIICSDCLPILFSDIRKYCIGDQN